MAKVIKRWHRESFSLAGQPVALKIKAASFDESPALLRQMEELGKSAISGDMAAVFSEQNAAFAADTFGRFVRPDEPLEDEDGKPIESGADLYPMGNPGFVLEVLRAVQRYAMLTAQEGKASSSPSMSSSETASSPASSDGGAPATESAPQP
jgi:hypothetical protein